MKRSLFVIGLLGLLICSYNSASAKDLRIGVVNMQRAVSETNEGKSEEAKLIKLKKKLEAELNRKLKEFYEKEGKLRKAWSILKDDEKRKRADSSRKEFEALQKRYMEAERSLMAKKTRVMMDLTKKITKVIARIAKKEKFDYIFTNAAVLWAPSHVDITNSVIRQFNNKK